MQHYASFLKMGVRKNISERQIIWKHIYFSILKQYTMDGFVQILCPGLPHFHFHETGQIHGCWVADVTSLFLSYCVLVLIWITWREQHMEARARSSCLFSPEPLLGLLCLWQWMKNSKWEINGEEAYFTCALGKTPECNSFWWLWL